MTVTVIEKQYPPAHLLHDSNDIKLTGNTLYDVMQQSIRRAAVIKQCNVDKAALRMWASDSAKRENNISEMLYGK